MNKTLSQERYETEYCKFLESIVDDCHCCRDCQNAPCDSVAAGGLCDDMCFCEESEEKIN